MKVFCFSFIVYFVLLLTQPCQDMVAIGDNCVAGDASFSQDDNRPYDDPRSDECSPFCICSCCSLSAVGRSVPKYVSARVEIVAIPAALIENSDPYSKAHQNSIWQPPKA